MDGNKMKLYIRNFRSIQEQEIELAPITVVYGPNGAGKSSLLYALLTLKNIILNPNQNPNQFFDYVFAGLGGFDAVIFDHQSRHQIELGLELVKDKLTLKYQASVGKAEGGFDLFLEGLDDDDLEISLHLHLSVSFPYPANQSATETTSFNQRKFTITWNGIVAQVQAQDPDQKAQEEANYLTALINIPAETLRRVGVVPLKRGFSKPNYSTVSVSPMLVTEDEVATSLAADKYLVSKVSKYLEQILDRDFRVNVRPGTAIFSLDATDRQTGVAAELVNEGFGVNQIVHMLARCLHQDTGRICVEEPEIHLHPTAVRNLAQALVTITHDEEKQFLISTHSENLILALLTLVREGKLKPSELACYFTQKENKRTQFERQLVHQNGQIEGGLTSFIEGELEDIAGFMGAE